MKTKTIIITLICLFVAVSLFFQSCKKEETNNQQPICEITTPYNGQEFQKGEPVTISVLAADSDGSISEVKFTINGIQKSTAISSPYTYTWNTSDVELGNSTINVTCIDNNGAGTTDIVTILIVGVPSEPVSEFISNITTGIAPLTINFSDQSVNEPTSWQWDFGDGGNSTTQSPEYAYSEAGLYSVSLTVTNSYGSNSVTKTNYIIVNGTFTDSRDNQIYKTIKIGDQTWFAENLNFETSNSWWYDNNSSSGNLYGRLYEWDAALTACPSGWHLPNDNEWKQLEMFIGMSESEANHSGWRGTNEGNKMKSNKTDWGESLPITNSYGFSALPSGLRDSQFGNFGGLGNECWLWTTSEYLTANGWFRGLSSSHNEVSRNILNKSHGLSVRCLKN
jgi:uncharacterized protein (TIGR02145 family)